MAGRRAGGRAYPAQVSSRRCLMKVEQTMGEVVVIGAGQIGRATARRVGSGKHVLLADLRMANAEATARPLSSAGFHAGAATVEVSSRESVRTLVDTATERGEVSGVIHAAGVPPSQASPEAILAVDCMARPSCSRNSGTSSPQADPAS